MPEKLICCKKNALLVMLPYRSETVFFFLMDLNPIFQIKYY